MCSCSCWHIYYVIWHMQQALKPLKEGHPQVCQSFQHVLCCLERLELNTVKVQGVTFDVVTEPDAHQQLILDHLGVQSLLPKPRALQKQQPTRLSWPRRIGAFWHLSSFNFCLVMHSSDRSMSPHSDSREAGKYSQGPASKPTVEGRSVPNTAEDGLLIIILANTGIRRAQVCWPTNGSRRSPYEQLPLVVTAAKLYAEADRGQG